MCSATTATLWSAALLRRFSFDRPIQRFNDLTTPRLLCAANATLSLLMAAPKRTLVIIAFAALYVIWGSTYLGIKFSIETIPPFLMAGARFRG